MRHRKPVEQERAQDAFFQLNTATGATRDVRRIGGKEYDLRKLKCCLICGITLSKSACLVHDDHHACKYELCNKCAKKGNPCPRCNKNIKAYYQK